MLKKVGIFMAVVCIGLIALVACFKFGTDKKGPTIQCSNDGLVYYDGMSDAELLEGVTAYDEKDGDVTDSLAVESTYPGEEGEVIVVYVAKDNSNNVTKLKQYVDSDSETVSTEEVEDTSFLETTVTPEAEAEPDVTEAPEDPAQTAVEDSVSSEETPDAAPTPSEGTTETDVTAADVSYDAEQLRQEQEAAAEQMPTGCPRIYLTDYLVKVQKGETVDRLSYVKEITDDADNIYELWRKVQITGDLDTATAGTYECTYYVIDSQGNTSNLAVLVYVVE